MDLDRPAVTRTGRATALGLAAGPLALIAGLVALPVATLMWVGLRPESLAVLAGSGTWRIVGYTAAQAAASTALSIIVALPAAYALHRLRLPGRRILLAVVTVPFVLPTVVVGLAFRELLPFAGTTAAIVVAHVFFNVGLVVRVVGGVWGRLDPRREQAAATLGLSPARVFASVTLPLLRPSIMAAAVLVFMFSFTSFGVVLIVGDPALPTIEVEVYRRAVQALDLDGAAALALLQLVIVVAAIAVATRLEGRLATAGALTRESPELTRPRGGAERASVAMTWALALLIVIPMAALVLRSLRVGDSWGLAWYAEVLAPTDRTTRAVSALASIATSLRYAAVAASIAVLLGSLGAVAIASLRRRGATLDAALALPLGVSAVTIGFGLLLASIYGPVDLRGAWILVPLGQALVAMPLVIRVVLPVLRGIDPRLRQVAASLGLPPARAWLVADGTQALRAVAVAAGLAAAVSLGEFGATAFLVRADTPTIPVQIVRLLGRPGEANLGQAMALAVILIVVTAIIVAMAERARPPRSQGW